MKNLLLILLTTISVNIFSQGKIYFDEDWKETTKKDAAFYRTIKDNGKIFEIRDYYIKGVLQFEGNSTVKTDPLSLEGTAIWYHSNGNVERKALFTVNVPQDSMLEYYSNGKIKSSAFYKDGKMESYRGYYPDGSSSGQADYLDGELHGELIKYQSPGRLEYKVAYKNGLMHGPYETYSYEFKLQNKGSTKDGHKEGLCTDYFPSGELRTVYTIKDKKIDGAYVAFSEEKDTTSLGEFENGVAVSFKSRRLGSLNGSIFGKEMNLVDGIEEWKTYRDGKLIIESFYKEGLYYGKWKIYNYDGSKLYKELDFSGNKDCRESYLQPKSEEFRPSLYFNDRFSLSNILEKEEDCESVKVTGHNISHEEHPIYYLERSEAKPREDKKDRNIVLDYIDPSSKEAFKLKNNCQVHEQYKEVSVCTRLINSITYKVFLSTDTDLLKKLKKAAKPKDFEIYFYFEQRENRDYDFNVEERRSRQLYFAFSDATAEAFENESLDYISVIGVLEHDFWNISDFSGMAAYSAFEKELEK